MSAPHQVVSFLTVNFNQPTVTLELLSSLEQMSFQYWECIVVDNGSQVSNLEHECALRPRIHYIKSEENLGFAGGNNLGLAHCSGDYIFLINNDTEVPRDFLEPLLKFAHTCENLGAVSPRIIFHHSPGIIQYAGSTPLNKITLRNRSVGSGERNEGQYDQPRKTPYIHGAAVMVPRKVVEEVGPLAEDYFLYYEEYDWSERIRAAGFDIWYFGGTEIYHKESVSTGRQSPLKTYYLTRNRLLMARRNLPSWVVAINYIYFTFIALPKNLLGFLVKGEFALARAFWRGYSYNLTNAARKRNS